MHSDHTRAPLVRFLRNVSPAVSIALIGMLAGGCAQTSHSKQTPAHAGNAGLSRQVVAKATVTAVDQSSRSLTLKNDEGKSLTVQAAPEVAHFDQIHVGDVVTVRYAESVAVSLLKPGQAAAPASATVAAGAGAGEKGKKAGAGIAGEITATVRIESVDAHKNIVVFTGPQGGLQVVNVVTPEGKEFIRGLKTGDQVEITYTAAMAVSVEKQ